MEQRISLVTLGVEDLARARAFYQRLGWVRRVQNAQGVAFFQAGGAVLALYPVADLAADAGLSRSAGGYTGVALAHNVRSPDQVDAVLAEAVAAGATLLKAARATSWGGYSGYFGDPDGHPWEIAWNPHFPLASDGSIELPD